MSGQLGIDAPVPGIGNMIAAPIAIETAPRLRVEFALDEGHGQIVQATLLLSALGVVEAWLNGAPVNDDLLAPGWTSYEWRVRYTVSDVTGLVSEGANALALQLGDGWYATPLFVPPHVTYGERPAGFAELHLHFADGHRQIVATDGDWLAGTSPISRSNIYNGQSIDARLIDVDWLRPGFAAKGWLPAEMVEFDTGKFDRQFGPSIRRIETLAPRHLWTSPSGKLLVDFGQNLVGWIRVKVKGAAGDMLTIRHAEIIEHEELGVRPLRSAKATDIYTLSGDEDLLEPTLVFHGFRYAEIDGWPGGIEALARDGGVEAVVIGSDLKRTGWFRCSNDDLNQLHSNVLWSTKGNFVGVPTDCPQRDERLGWTGDLAVFAPTAAFLFDVEDFLREWLCDLRIEQAQRDGLVPWVVPDILKYFDARPLFKMIDTTAIWSDAVVWVPRAIWDAYGDKRVLAETFDAQVAHVNRAWSQLSDRGVWEGRFQFGDWLDPEAPPQNPLAAKADAGVVATISLYRSLRFVAEAAAVLDRDDEAEFAEKAAILHRSFYAAYVEDGRIESDCTTVYAMAIVFGILDQADIPIAGERLAELARASGHRISTGFAGTPYVCDALARTGHLDDAYAMLLETKCPSWLYPVRMGATTIWERWDSMLADGSINPGEMTSFNHYALGAVADWMHRTIGGIAPLSAVDGRYRVAPRPGGGVSWAETAWETRQGLLRVRWDLDAGELRVQVNVPEGASVELALPGRDAELLGAGSHERVQAIPEVRVPL
ncbi:alpha-L-rhamnosidase [Sphingomonas alpina]|nr:alpha-L-rhamnosidase [Sphingomonas alpina]